MSSAIPFKLPPDGRVILDDSPIELPTRLSLPQSRADQIREFIRSELSRQAESAGAESFEEADDFSFDEDEPMTPYELAMLDGEIQEVVDRIKAERAARKAPTASDSSSESTSPSVDGFKASEEVKP